MPLPFCAVPVLPKFLRDVHQNCLAGILSFPRFFMKSEGGVVPLLVKGPKIGGSKHGKDTRSKHHENVQQLQYK